MWRVVTIGFCHFQVYRKFIAQFYGNRFLSFCVIEAQSDRQADTTTLSFK